MKWIKLAEATVPTNENDIRKVKVAGKQVCLIWHAGTLHATAARCPHAGADLSGGWCEEGRLICPYHRHAFNLESGRGDAGQGDYLKVYPLEKREAGWFIGLKDSWLKKFFLVLLCCTLFSHAYPQALLDWPQRPIHAKSGSELTELWMHVDQSEREQQIKKELLNGNFPDFMRQLVQIDLSGGVSYWVMPDYLMVGSDLDFLRLPMTPNTAQFIADSLGFFLSTAKIADDVYQAATVKLEPLPLTVERELFATFILHHEMIEAQREGRNGLIAGIKKDVISTPRLFATDRPNRVALYGWHKLDGVPIQPIYTGHVDHYVDYSHGFRLVWEYVRVGEIFIHYTDVLKNPQLRHMLTNEGNEQHFKYEKYSSPNGRRN